MKNLEQILENINITESIGNLKKSVNSIIFDSRKVSKDDIFVATVGTTVDSHKFIDSAIKDGANTIILEKLPENISPETTYIQVENSLKALGICASNYYENPSSKLKIVGITGTNGKTTIATLLYQLFKKSGYAVGLLSTVKNYINNTEIIATHTTPDAVQINKLMNDMVIAGCEYCFMEVSSHAIVQDRIAGLDFVGGVFTNITHDHLDYHKTFKEYINAKKLFFDNLNKNAFAITNSDDKNGMVMLQNTAANKQTYSLKSVSDFKCKILENHFGGNLLNINNIEVWTKLIGNFNAYNLLAVYAVAKNLGLDELEILQIISQLESVSGRFEYIQSVNNITAIIDYAHTPDAVKNVLSTIDELRTKNEQVITVIGAGGNRDKTKRPEMAKIATQFSDTVILTSDNPRNEKPDDIINDMVAGVDASNTRKILTITDRRMAIKTAFMMAKPNDIILIAGKGHENYQEVNGVKSHFDDKEEITNLFNQLN